MPEDSTAPPADAALLPGLPDDRAKELEAKITKATSELDLQVQHCISNVPLSGFSGQNGLDEPLRRIRIRLKDQAAHRDHFLECVGRCARTVTGLLYEAYLCEFPAIATDERYRSTLYRQEWLERPARQWVANKILFYEDGNPRFEEPDPLSGRIDACLIADRIEESVRSEAEKKAGECPRVPRGRPPIPLELKEKALGILATGGSNKDAAKLLYRSPYPTERQVKDTAKVLGEYRKKRSRNGPTAATE